MFCINCGREIKEDHRFCAVCGADQHPNGYNTNGNYQHTETRVGKDNEKALAIISYLGVLSVISYFVSPKNSPFARLHAVQGINLFIFECILGVARAILKGGFSWLWPVNAIVSVLAAFTGIGFLVLTIMGIVSASRGEMKELPVIGSWKIVKD